MLKDKSAYANENIYANQYYHHKAEVKDFPIDPMLGSFIRILYPPKDMPEGSNAIYTRPQFMFMNRDTRSRMYEVKEVSMFIAGVAEMIDRMERDGSHVVQMTLGRTLEIDELGAVSTKDHSGVMMRMIAHPPTPKHNRGPNTALLTKKRYIQCLHKLHRGLVAVGTGLGEPEQITRVGDELMFTMKRPDHRVSIPVVVTARYFPDRKDHYIILHSNNQRMIFLADQAEETFTRYFNETIRIAENLQEHGKVGDGEVKFIYAKPYVIDENMEYVNVRKVDFTKGEAVHVMLNSDRFPGNTKFAFVYDNQFSKELRDRLLLLVKEFEGIKNEKASANSITD